MLAEKAIYSTRQTVRREEQYFWFFQNIFKLPISISSFFQWYDIIYCSNSAFPWISNSKRAKLKLPLWQIYFQKVYLFKRVSQLLPSISSILLEYLHHFYVIIFYGVFFRYLFLFVFVCGFTDVLLSFLFFSLSFSFMPKILALAIKMQLLQQPLLNWI